MLLAACLSAISLIAWEMYWRSEGYPIGPDDNKHIWADNRHRIEKMDSNDVVIVGSSRAYFDLQLPEFEESYGRKPVMLAIEGTNPMAVLQDVAGESTFSGKLILGVTSPLYFSPPIADNFAYRFPQGWVEHFYNRTWADRFTSWVERPLQNNFAFLSSHEDGFSTDIDLRTLIERIPTPARIDRMPPIPIFKTMDYDRNLTMYRAHEDTAYARIIMNFWEFVAQPPADPPSEQEVEKLRQQVVEMTAKAASDMREKGGELILFRAPFEGVFGIAEPAGFPRQEYWDALAAACACPSYHYADHKVLQGYELPEWSHMSPTAARSFTKEFVKLLIQDGVLTPQ
jgi:hypothetical protein